MHVRKRLLIHLILAVFIASAANKFFIPDLEFEIENQFYANILDFNGNAPDQYRILPLLGIKAVWKSLQFIKAGTPFNHAVLVFNFACAFVLFELFFALMRHHDTHTRLLFNLIFAILYIYTLYTGWRPDTLGLVLLGSAYCLYFSLAPPGWRGALVHIIAIILLSFSRSDVALIYGCFVAFYIEKRSWLRVLLIAIPILIQLLLQFVIFQEAQYYTKAIMIWDNIGMYYLWYNPATWLIIAAALIFYKKINIYIKKSVYAYPFFYTLMGAYFVLVFVFGRINEYRLYLPFVPLFIIIDRKIRSNFVRA